MKKCKEITEWFLCIYFVILSTQYIGSSALITILILLMAAVICPLQDKWIIELMGRRTALREVLAFIIFFFAAAVAP